MMLRASVDGTPEDTRPALDAAGRIALLESFVDAVVGPDPRRADQLRHDVADQLGPDWLVDASAVIANFEMMTRLADGTGARLRPAQIEASAALCAELGIDGFASRRT
jgi:hypothetical protein